MKKKLGFSILFHRNQASFKLDKRNNIWYLHSEGIGGNNIDFIMKYLNASVKEVLEWAEKANFSSFQPQNIIQKQNSLKPNYQITEIKELKNENLKNYLHQRGLSTTVYSISKEIHFTIEGKKLYAIGFENFFRRLGTTEIQFIKGSLLKKIFQSLISIMKIKKTGKMLSFLKDLWMLYLLLR